MHPDGGGISTAGRGLAADDASSVGVNSAARGARGLRHRRPTAFVAPAAIAVVSAPISCVRRRKAQYLLPVRTRPRAKRE